MTKRLPPSSVVWLVLLVLCMSCRVPQAGVEPRSDDVEIPAAKPNLFAVVVADLEGDDGSMKELVIQELADLSAEIPSLQVLDVKVALKPSSGPDRGRGIEGAQEQARMILEQTGASVVVWGRVQAINDRDKQAALYLTTLPKRRGEGRSDRFVPGSDLVLPAKFWRHFSDILAMLVVVESTQYDHDGYVDLDRLRPFIEKVESLRGSEEFRRQWGAYERATVDFVLGHSWGILAEQSGDVEAFRAANKAFLAALEGYDTARLPYEWARTQLEIGALLTMSAASFDDGRDRLQQSIAADRAALEILTRERHPRDWAVGQNNLGNALMVLGMREETDAHLWEAMQAYTAALEVYTREQHPLEWGMIKCNLGSLLVELGNREEGLEQLRRAEAAYRAMLEVYTRERHPGDWSLGQSNLGIVLTRLAQREGRADRAQAAVEALKSALEIRTRDHFPVLWAESQLNLGTALFILAELTDESLFIEAEAAFLAALEVYTREQLPFLWAQAESNLGGVLTKLAEQDGADSVGLLKRAIEAHRSALEVYTREDLPLQWATTQMNLGASLALLGIQVDDVELMQESVVVLRSTLEVFTRELFPNDWANAQGNLGVALRKIGRHTGELARLQEALVAFDATLEVYNRDLRPREWASAMVNIGVTHEAIFATTDNPEDSCAALAAYLLAWSVHRSMPTHRDDARHSIHRASDRLISARHLRRDPVGDLVRRCPNIDRDDLESFEREDHPPNIRREPP